MGGGTLSGKVYDKKACYLKVLEVDDKHANAWSNLDKKSYQLNEAIVKNSQMLHAHKNHNNAVPALL